MLARAFPPKPKTDRSKLKFSSPGDVYEQEADRLAAHVMHMTKPRQSLLQDKISTSQPSITSAALPVIGGTFNDAGRPLDASTRNFMEPRFGVDFSRVRIHTDAQAAESARAVNALAFTAGNHIVFGANQYIPESHATHSLLAHELTHVIQQNRLGGSVSGQVPAIQRLQPGDSGEGGVSPPGAELRRQYIEVACEVIAEIRRGVEEGRTWTFENEFLLQGEEELMNPESSLVRERYTALQQLIAHLDEIIQELESGTLTPSQPASRDGLRALWRARHPGTHWRADRRPPAGHPARWSVPTGSRHVPGEETSRRVFPSLGGYINNPPSSPPGMLSPASFPTWWVIGCHTEESPARPLTADGRVTPEQLGLSRNTVVFVARDSSGVITNWHWEPRRESHPEALRPFGPHEWHYDESAGRVYVIVNGRQYNLLPNGRIEIQGESERR